MKPFHPTRCSLIVVVMLICPFAISLDPAAGAEAIQKTAGGYDVTVSLSQSMHGRSTTERLALSIAQSKLVGWLQVRNLRWPGDIVQADRPFFMNLYRLAKSNQASFGSSELIRSSTKGKLMTYTFHINKKGIRVDLPTWSEMFVEIVGLTKRPDKLTPLMHLELADRYPNDIKHGPVVSRLRSEIGGDFLKFVTGADVDRIDTGPILSSVPEDALQLAKLLGKHPYNIDLAFVMIRALRGTALRSVLCRITDQAQRGSKLSPSYPLIRDFGRDTCGKSGSHFAEGVSDDQIEDMRAELVSASVRLDGVARLVAESFGELPLNLAPIYETTKASQRKKCSTLGLSTCVAVFNNQPSIVAARHIAELMEESDLTFLATAFYHQIWVWAGVKTVFSASKAGTFPLSE